MFWMEMYHGGVVTTLVREGARDDGDVISNP